MCHAEMAVSVVIRVGATKRSWLPGRGFGLQGRKTKAPGGDSKATNEQGSPRGARRPVQRSMSRALFSHTSIARLASTDHIR